MFELLLKFRYITLVMVILSLLHAIAYLILGTKIAFHAYAQILHPEANSETRPGLELLHSLDFLFVSLVLVVLGLGIAKLFLLPADSKRLAGLPSWLHIESIAELKVLLWETILTTLLIGALSELVAGFFGDLNWSILILPSAILILALSLFFIKKA